MESILRNLRQKDQLKLDTVAKKLQISPGYLHQIETGHRSISRARAEEFAKIYDVAVEDLFESVRYVSRRIVSENDSTPESQSESGAEQ